MSITPCRQFASKSGFLKVFYPFGFCLLLVGLTYNLKFNGLGTLQGKYNHQKLGHQTIKLNQIPKDNYKNSGHQTVKLNQLPKDNYEKSGQHQTAKLNQIQKNKYEKPGHQKVKSDQIPKDNYDEKPDHQTVELNLIPKVAKDDNEEIQQARKKLIADNCEGTGIASSASQFLVDERHELLYCYIPKAASTNIKRLMLILSGHVDPKDLSAVYDYKVHFNNPMTQIEADGVEKLEKLGLDSYSKFIFTRHPFERLVSAYYDKFTYRNKSRVVPFATESVENKPEEGNHRVKRASFSENNSQGDNFKLRIGTKIIEKYRENPSQRSLKKGDDVTVPEFVNYVIDEWAERDVKPLDPHWRSQVELCRPCSIQYDIVGKFETMQEDIDYLLRKLEEDEISKIFHEYKPYTTSSLVTEFMEQVSDQQWEDLVRIYQDDFDVFGYDPDVYSI